MTGSISITIENKKRCSKYAFNIYVYFKHEHSTISYNRVHHDIVAIMKVN